ncbi:MAG: type VI secretion system-associated FHA domain protein TagH [Rubrivivax sp.]
MITLTVVSFNGVPGDGSLSASFDELGGTIGRADTNQLVLPDPERTISRVHAQVAFRNGQYAIVDRGSNPISVNGRTASGGKETLIAVGDQIQVGGYLIEARAAGAGQKARDDPFADLLGPAGAATAGVDPLAAFAFEPSPPTGPAVYSRGAAGSPPAAAPAGIPDDWDPFAPDPAPNKPASQDFAKSLGRKGAGNLGLDGGAAAPGALIPDLPASGLGSDISLDNLFGLKPGATGDPLANSVLDNPMSKPNMAASHDPMQSLNSAPRASAATDSDTLSDLQRPFIAPLASKPKAPEMQSAPTAGASPPPGVPSGAVLSWDSQGGDGHTVIRPAPRVGNTVAAAVVAPTPLAAVPSGMAQPSIAVPSAVAATQGADRPASMPSGAGADHLLAAFREGLAAPTVQIDALTPDLMRLMGQLLHESARGTVDLLVARAALKREVRAESTMIVARENNPLKFSPSADAALQHLLSPPTRGFMPAAPAMRDAYDDLRAHQFGFIAGMRAALEGVLARFDPAQLEGRLTQRSMLQSLLPGSRKARMWEVFVEHFEQISNEASDDFHTLFGKAFLKAYEEHIDQLKGDAN